MFQEVVWHWSNARVVNVCDYLSLLAVKVNDQAKMKKEKRKVSKEEEIALSHMLILLKDTELLLQIFRLMWSGSLWKTWSKRKVMYNSGGQVMSVILLVADFVNLRVEVLGGLSDMSFVKSLLEALLGVAQHLLPGSLPDG